MGLTKFIVAWEGTDAVKELPCGCDGVPQSDAAIITLNGIATYDLRNIDDDTAQMLYDTGRVPWLIPKAVLAKKGKSEGS